MFKNTDFNVNVVWIYSPWGAIQMMVLYHDHSLWNRFKLQGKDTLLWNYKEIVYSRISIYENKYLHVELGWVGGASIILSVKLYIQKLLKKPFSGVCCIHLLTFMVNKTWRNMQLCWFHGFIVCNLLSLITSGVCRDRKLSHLFLNI